MTVAGSLVAPEMKEAQKAVVERLLLRHNFAHVCIDSDDHAGALNEVFAWLNPSQPVVLLDVDCIPLDADIVMEGVGIARDEGTLVGAMQAANHIDTEEAYVGPFFWIGVPDNASLLNFRATPHADVGQRVSRCWCGDKLYLPPTRCRVPRWKVLGRDFGLGTYYGDEHDKVYHEFEARNRAGVNYFVSVCQEVLSVA